MILVFPLLREGVRYLKFHLARNQRDPRRDGWTHFDKAVTAADQARNPEKMSTAVTHTTSWASVIHAHYLISREIGSHLPKIRRPLSERLMPSPTTNEHKLRTLASIMLREFLATPIPGVLCIAKVLLVGICRGAFDQKCYLQRNVVC